MSVLTDIHNTEPLILFKILFIYDGENNTLIIDATTATFSLLTRSKVELNAYYTPKNSPAWGGHHTIWIFFPEPANCFLPNHLPSGP